MSDIRLVNPMEVDSMECRLVNYATNLWKAGRLTSEERDNFHRLAHDMGKVVYFSPVATKIEKRKENHG